MCSKQIQLPLLKTPTHDLSFRLAFSESMMGLETSLRLLCKDSVIQSWEKLHLLFVQWIAHAISIPANARVRIHIPNRQSQIIILMLLSSKIRLHCYREKVPSRLFKTKISASKSVNLRYCKGLYSQQFLEFMAMSLFLASIFYSVHKGFETRVAYWRRGFYLIQERHFSYS